MPSNVLRDPDGAHLRAIWSDLLSCEVRADTHFFVSGGDSLSGALLIARVNHRFGTGLTIADLFENPEFGDFRTWLTHQVAESAPAGRFGAAERPA
jgi:yersiniabactin nonribosomal peptide/polyketide synthase